MGSQLQRAYTIVKQTSPYVLYRTATYALLGLGVVGYLLMLALIGAVFGAGVFWVLLAVSTVLAGATGIPNFLSESVFQRQRAGHVALITEIITEGQLPIGISQTKWARGRVLYYFHSLSLLPEIRRLLRACYQTIHQDLVDVTDVMPVSGIDKKAKLAQYLMGVSQSYVEEATIAYVFKAKNQNVYDAVKSAVVSYGPCWRPVLGNAVASTLMGYAFAMAATVASLVPLGIVSLILPDQWSLVRFTLFALGVLVGFIAKWTLFDPVACASVMLTFFGETDLLTPDVEWEATLESSAPAFRELKAKAAARPSDTTGPEDCRARSGETTNDESPSP